MKLLLSQTLTDSEVTAFHHIQVLCYGRQIVEFTDDDENRFIGIIHPTTLENLETIFALVTRMVEKVGKE